MAGWGEYPRQHEHELCILRGLSAYDLHDIYRRLHGSARQTQDEGWSWCYRNHIKYRFDHLLALCPVQAQYLHAFRERNLSAHAPLEVLFEPASRQDVELRLDYTDYGDHGDDDDRISLRSSCHQRKE